MRRSFLAIICVASFLAPLAASAATIDDLQAKLTLLLQQVDEVKTEIAALQASTTPSGTPPFQLPHFPLLCLPIVHPLSLGSTDAATDGEVTKLQQLLAQSPTLYPEALITGFFGAATERAVQRLQQQGNIVSSGTVNTTGFGLIGPATRAFLLSQCTQLPPGGTATTSWPLPPGFSTTTSAFDQLPMLTINISSLTSSSTPFTVTGTARNVDTVLLTITQSGNIMFTGSTNVVSGGWSETITQPLAAGIYQIEVAANNSEGSAKVKGVIVLGAVPGLVNPIATSSPTCLPNTGACPPSPCPPSGLCATPFVNLTPSSNTNTSSSPPPSSVSSLSTSVGPVVVLANGSPNGAYIPYGASAYIGWSSTGVTSCSISSSPASQLSGPVPSSALANSTDFLIQTTTFTVTCTGTTGPVSGSVTVYVRPLTTSYPTPTPISTCPSNLLCSTPSIFPTTSLPAGH